MNTIHYTKGDSLSAQFYGIHIAPEVRTISTETLKLLVNLESGKWINLSQQGYDLFKTIVEGEHPDTNNEMFQILSSQYSIEKEKIDSFIQTLEANKFITIDDSPSSFHKKMATMNMAKPCNGCDKSRRSVSCVILNITNRCNLRCRHCAVYEDERNALPAGVAPLSHSEHNRKDGTQGGMNGDPSANDIFQLIDHFGRCEVQHLVLYGGEPLLRSDIVKILQYCAGRFSKLGLATNGTLMSLELCKTIASCVSQVMISLDGSNANTHDAMRGRGAFQKTMDGIRMLQAADCTNILLKAVVTRQNVNNIPNMVRLARKLGVRLELSVYHPLGRGCVAMSEYELDSDKIIEAFKRFWLLAEYYELPSASFNATCSRWIGQAAVNCGAGVNCQLVDTNGNVYPCEGLQYLPFKFGNLREQLNERELVLPQIAGRSVDDLAYCSDCSVRYFCRGGCAAVSYSSQHLDQPSMVLCNFYKRLLPKVIENWDPKRNSWMNLKRVFGEDINLGIIREYLPGGKEWSHA
jgi:radical SAM protein with 4Fe4S-binding SPASM domain